MKMFVLPVAISTCADQFCRKKGSAVVVILQPSHCVYCLFMTLLISSCHHSRIYINSQRARALQNWRMYMQTIAVGVTNRRDQQIYSFRGPF